MAIAATYYRGMNFSAQVIVPAEAMLLEPVLAPLFAGCDAIGQVEAGEFALQLAKQLQVRP
ncbi:MAG TPA: hypothetical protein VGG89_13385 [Candidatus Baltobacteraceae bacterium]